MGWSTREIAELAGTSLRSVRHYHQVGLLPEPERRPNGYKQYGVPHLVRLLRIKRLVGLGFSLPQIAELGDGDEHPEEALRALDADLVAQIERLHHARRELAEILEQGVPTDLPPEFARARQALLTEADRNVVSVMGRLLGESERATYAELLTDEVRRDCNDDFDVLPADADDDTRQELAVRMTADLRELLEKHPDVIGLGTEAPLGAHRYRKVVDQAMSEIYNPAQLDVLRRLRVLIREEST